MKTLSDVIAEAFKSRDELHALSDQMGRKLAEIEKLLVELKLGVAARVVITSDDEDSSFLGFEKIDGSWRLAWTIAAVDGIENTVPLTSAPRSVRLKLIPFIRSLILKLTVMVEPEKHKVEAQNKELDDVIAELKTVDPSQSKAPSLK